MHPPDHEQAKHKVIISLAKTILRVDFKLLYKTEELGSALSFEFGHLVFERIYRLVGNIDEAKLAMLSMSVLERLERFLVNAQNLFERITTFRIQGRSDPVGERNGLVRNLDNEYAELFREAPAVGMFLHTPEATPVPVLPQITFPAEAEWRAKLEDISASAKRAGEMVDEIRKASGSFALQRYSEFFEKEATAAGGVAKKWLLATLAVAVALFSYLIWLVFVWTESVPDYSVIQALQVGGTKVALFTVGFYVVSWCGRNFKSQWHIRVVNGHRANTLNALEAFANSAKNEQTREAILIHASSAIFAQVNTGFIPDQSDAPHAPSILEIVRGGKE